MYRHKEKIYIQPGKVQHRYSRTMYTLHGWEGDEFRPVADSATITEILAEVPWSNLDTATIDRGYWSSSFTQAREILAQLKRGQPVEDQAAESFERLVRMAITHDPQVIQMAEEYLGLEDMVNVRKRMIGTGHLGGKAVGLLLARAILEKKDKKWGERLEPHDSFYVGSDVYYSFLVNNGVWWLRSKQTDPNMFLRGAADARHRILNGSFPDYIQTQFSDMLDHFGQSPIIVRSSSLLEDSFGATFAGKGKSVMCANQGPRRQRLEDLMAAVRTVYASTMSESALNYRARRGILDRDEQMALLIQRVSGSVHGHLFFPTIAGVGFSFNPYVWSEYIDAKAGMLRLVCGLGTRAVERSDEDYTRIVALNEPQRRPETSLGEVRQYSQRNIDVIDLDGNRQVSYDFKQVAECDPGLALEWIASRDREVEKLAKEKKLKNVFPWVLTFDKLLADSSFVGEMGEMLGILQEAYGQPVDIEFAADLKGDDYRINLLQCRPLQMLSQQIVNEPPAELKEGDTVLRAEGAVIGKSRMDVVDRIIYVAPSAYGELPLRDRYAIARLIGRLCALSGKQAEQGKAVMLVGPGRWGTTAPELGVPLAFSEIQSVSILGEIVAMRDNLVPDVSLGTHVFNELVEMDILYFALFPDHENNFLNRAVLEERGRNRLADLLPDDAQWEQVVRVIDSCDLRQDGQDLCLYANALKQTVVCYLD